MQEIFTFQGDTSSIQKKIPAILDELESCESFAVGFQGELGAGKTYLIGRILYALGLDPQVPVVSPTYAVLNDYQIPQGLFIHADLYKLNWQNVPLEEYLADYSFKGAFIEWCSKEDSVLTHFFEISYLGADQRRYVFYKR